MTVTAPQEKEFRTYLFSYRHDGKEWGFDVQATSPEDAKARVSQMGLARYDGELEMTISFPDTRWTRWLVHRVLNWISRGQRRNFLE